MHQGRLRNHCTSEENLSTINTHEMSWTCLDEEREREKGICQIRIVFLQENDELNNVKHFQILL